MVNLVIVSHSAKLAEGVGKFWLKWHRGCKIALAGGIEDTSNPIGTDAVKIMQAIESVFSPDGVIVFVDLGSAILSTQTAIDLLEPELAEKVIISYAPLVEGAFAAVVAASAGDSLEAVLNEANEAAALKQEQAN